MGHTPKSWGDVSRAWVSIPRSTFPLLSVYGAVPPETEPKGQRFRPVMVTHCSVPDRALKPGRFASNKESAFGLHQQFRNGTSRSSSNQTGHNHSHSRKSWDPFLRPSKAAGPEGGPCCPKPSAPGAEEHLRRSCFPGHDGAHGPDPGEHHRGNNRAVPC